MISKELLSDVFNREVTSLTIIDADVDTHDKKVVMFQFKNIYYGGVSGIDDESINLYELAHKCIEWVLKTHKYSIAIMYDVDMFRQDSLRFSVKIITRDGITVFKIKDMPEYEAIFKVCQWILDNKDKA